MFASLFLAILMGFLLEGRPVLAQAPYPVSDTSLDLDDFDQPAIVYYDIANQDLKQARWDGSAWQKEVVDSGGDVGEGLSLVLDSNDRSKIAYYDATNQDLKYADWDGSSWQIQTLDNRNVLKYLSLALDKQDSPRIGYHVDGALVYWQAEPLVTIPLRGGPVEDISLKLNSLGEASMSFFEPQYQMLAFYRIQPSVFQGYADYGGGGYGGQGIHSSLVVDQAGRPHIAYFDENNTNLKYAYWDGLSWQRQTVDGSGYVGEYVSLALDSAGYPNISYLDSTGNDQLKYARWNGSSWSREVVDTGGEWGMVGQYTSIALDAADRPHISYYAMTGWGPGLPHDNDDLRYAYWNGSSWLIQTADAGEVLRGETTETVGLYTSIALDTLGNPHISYYDASNGDLKYASWDGSSWQIEIADAGEVISVSPGGRITTETVGYYTSLALDAFGNPHISYRDSSNQDLKYAHWDGSSWQIERIDSERNVGLYSSIFLDTNDRPHISYYDDSNIDIKYARWNGSSWQIEAVDASIGGRYYKYRGIRTSLGLDSANNAHISYYDEEKESLEYAYWNGSSWQFQTADGPSQVGKYSSLGVDTTDHFHISYYDLSNKDLKYAYGEVSNWRLEVVDSEGAVGEFTSLDLDSLNHPHISYYDATNQDLKYAYWNGTSWQRETVDSNGAVGLYTSLKLDSSDYPHISYFNSTCDKLKYAWWDGSAWQVRVVDTIAAIPQGDLDNDGDVDSQDVIILLENWGNNPSLPAADLNRDGKVNGLDFGKMLQLM